MSEASVSNSNGKREREEDNTSTTTGADSELGDQQRPSKSMKNHSESDAVSDPAQDKENQTDPANEEETEEEETSQPTGEGQQPGNEEADKGKLESSESTPSTAEVTSAPAAERTDAAAPAATEGDIAFVVDRTGALETKETAEAPAAAPKTEPSEEPKPAAAAPAPAAPAPAPVVTGVDPTVQATLVNPTQIVEERGEIPALYVGKVIGKVGGAAKHIFVLDSHHKHSFLFSFCFGYHSNCLLLYVFNQSQGGEMIRDLQARSGARIDVDQNVPPGQPRGISYRGTRKTVDFAKQLVAMLQQENVNEDNLPLGDATRRYVIIPAQAVGKVIGRGGEMIRELQNKSQAKIQIDHTGASGLSPEQKQVSITGTEQAVTKAEEMINFLSANPYVEGLQAISMLIDEKLRTGNQWGTGPPYNMPNQGVNMTAEMLGQQPGAAAYGGYGGYQQQQPAYGYAPAPGYVPPAATAGGQVYGGQEVDVVYAQKQYMGRIIGKKGATINDLQRRSSCDIQVNQDVAPGQDCEITVRGTRAGIEMVKTMIKEIIEIGPQHPVSFFFRSNGSRWSAKLSF